MSRPEVHAASTTSLPYSAPVNFDDLDITVGDPGTDGLIPIRVGATGQTIKLHSNVPPENVLRIIEGHVRAVRRSKTPGMPGYRSQQGQGGAQQPGAVSSSPASTAAMPQLPPPPGSTPTTSAAGSPISEFLSHAVRSTGLDDPIGNIGRSIDAFRSNPRAFIQSLASPSNLPPTEDTRIPAPAVRDPRTGAMVPAPNTEPLRPSAPATAVESIPIIGPILTNIRTAQESGNTAGALGEAAPLIPGAMRAAGGITRGALTAGKSLASGSTALESLAAGASSATGTTAAIPGRGIGGGATTLRVGNTDVPLMLDEVNAHRPGLAEVFGRLGSTSQPVKDFNISRMKLMQRAIEEESQSLNFPGKIRTLDGTEVDAAARPGLAANRSFPGSSSVSLHDFDQMSPLSITEVRTALPRDSYDRLLQRFFGQMFEDSMKPGTPNSPPSLDPKLLMQKIDAVPRENVEAMFGMPSGSGLRGRPSPYNVTGAAVMRNMRDLASTMSEIQDNGALVGKIERLHVAGYRRFGPMFLYLQDATGLIGINHLAGIALVHPEFMQGLKSFLKATPKTAAEMTAAEGLVDKALEENYGRETSQQDQPSSNLKAPLLSDRAPGSNDAVLSDLVDSVTGDPRLFSAAMDHVDRILYGDKSTQSSQAADRIFADISPTGIPLRSVVTRAFRSGSLGEAFSTVMKAIDNHAMPPGGGDPQITTDILRSKVPEEQLTKTGILDWLQAKVSSGTKIYRNELKQLAKNLQYRAKDASPAEFELVRQEAGTAMKGSVEQAQRQSEVMKNKGAMDRVTQEVEAGRGFEEYKVKSIEELASIPGRPAWAQLPGGGKQYVPALDHRVLTEEKNWKRMLFQAKSDIDLGYDKKTPAQIKKAEDTIIRVLAKYRKWEQDVAQRYEGIQVDPPINVKIKKTGGGGMEDTGTTGPGPAQPAQPAALPPAPEPAPISEPTGQENQ